MYDKWSLEVLYSGFEDEKFKKDMARVDELIGEYTEFAASLGSEDARTTVKKAIALDEELELLIDGLYSYCSLRQSVDTSDTDSVSYIGRLMQKLGDVTKPSTLMDQYIAKIENIDDVIGDDELLCAYSDRLLQIQKRAKYMLSEDVEEALARMDVWRNAVFFTVSATTSKGWPFTACNA